MKEINNDLWEKATNVASGISKLIWAHKYFYIYPHIDEDLEPYNVYLNEYGKFSVKLDDGSEFFLIQPCPHLIYQLYEAESNKETTFDNNTAIRANAYEKFESFFKFMQNYCRMNIVG